MKQIAGLFVILVSVMFFAAWTTNSDGLKNLDTKLIQANRGSEQKNSSSDKKIVKIQEAQIQVLIADDPEERTVGLSKHESIDENSGMLFVFEKDRRPSFWMKDMKFPIDIIWIDNEEVVQIDADIQTVPASTPPGQIRLYFPAKPIDYVLEIQAGQAKKKDIKVGDKVVLPQ